MMKQTARPPADALARAKSARDEFTDEQLTSIRARASGATRRELLKLIREAENARWLRERVVAADSRKRYRGLVVRDVPEPNTWFAGPWVMPKASDLDRQIPPHPISLRDRAKEKVQELKSSLSQAQAELKRLELEVREYRARSLK